MSKIETEVRIRSLEQMVLPESILLKASGYWSQGTGEDERLYPVSIHFTIPSGSTIPALGRLVNVIIEGDWTIFPLAGE
jgi:hypothetical protein